MTELTVVLNHNNFALNHQDKQSVANTTYPKGGNSCSKDIPIAIGIVVNGSRKLSGLVFQFKFCGRSPALRVAAKCYTLTIKRNYGR